MPGEVLTLTQKEARCPERDGYLTGAHVELTPGPQLPSAALTRHRRGPSRYPANCDGRST
jgi:hypothetical protein